MNEQQRQVIREILKKAGLDANLGGQDVETVFAQMVKERIPGVSSQAQHAAFMSGFEAFCFTMQAICSGDKEQEALGRKTLDQAFDVARKATEITEKLREVPEAAVSDAAEVFKRPPAEFIEAEIQQTLLAELEKIDDAFALAAWYDTNKGEDGRFTAVKTQCLRNALFDAIRKKHATLVAEQGKVMREV